MGTFGGHALPGSFFIFWSLWWCVHIFRRYYASKRRNVKFTSTCTYNASCLCGRLKDWPIEGALKIFCIAVGFTGEIITGFDDAGTFVNLGNGQHATMFFFFGVSGIVDILMYLKAPLPKDCDYVVLTGSFIIEWLLFNFHLHGRTELDVLLHTLLLYALVANILACLVEMRYRHNVLAPLARTFCVLLQGTWFWQVGFILYNPLEGAVEWDPDSHDQMMIATLYFAWHCAANFIIILLIGVLVNCCQTCCGGAAHDPGDVSMKRLIQTGSNGQTFVSLHDDSESETEYEKLTQNDH